MKQARRVIDPADNKRCRAYERRVDQTYRAENDTLAPQLCYERRELDHDIRK